MVMMVSNSVVVAILAWPSAGIGVGHVSRASRGRVRVLRRVLHHSMQELMHLKNKEINQFMS